MDAFEFLQNIRTRPDAYQTGQREWEMRILLAGDVSGEKGGRPDPSDVGPRRARAREGFRDPGPHGLPSTERARRLHGKGVFFLCPVTHRSWAPNPAGLSYLEVVLAAAVVAVVFFAGFALVVEAEKSSALMSVRADVKRRARAVTEPLVQELAQARVISISPSNESLVLQVPVDHDDDGDVVDDHTGQVEYGYFDAGGKPRLGWTVTYRAVVESILSEAEAGRDFNGDGMQNTTFAVCRLDREVRDASGRLQDTLTLVRDLFLNADPLDGDVDGDGTGDPLFSLQDASGHEVGSGGSRVVLKIWLASARKDETFYLHSREVSVHLRNEQ